MSSYDAYVPVLEWQFLLLLCREELEKQKAHERYMRLQEQGKTEQAKKDLGKLWLQLISVSI